MHFVMYIACQRLQGVPKRHKDFCTVTVFVNDICKDASSVFQDSQFGSSIVMLFKCVYYHAFSLGNLLHLFLFRF